MNMPMSMATTTTNSIIPTPTPRPPCGVYRDESARYERERLVPMTGARIGAAAWPRNK